MDCPKCLRSMRPIIKGENTIGWICPYHGKFDILCECGTITEEHEVLCEKIQNQ